MSSALVPQPPSLFGLVLAGGMSSRMGHDKSLITYHDKPQREYLFDLLNKFCVKVFTSCKATDEIPPHLNPLPDKFDIHSPLNGIISAFEMRNDVAWLSIAVDMPLIDEKTVDYLLFHRSPTHMATCFFDSDGKNPEPLLTIWEPKAATALHNFFKTGNVSPRNFLKQSPVNIIKAFNVNVLTNINSTDELNAFLKNQS
jgi:molybdenum cofactor guanylyltransferase